MTKPCKELIKALGVYAERLPEAATLSRNTLLWEFGPYSIRVDYFPGYRCDAYVEVHECDTCGRNSVVASWIGSASRLEKMIASAAQFVVARMEEEK